MAARTAAALSKNRRVSTGTSLAKGWRLPFRCHYPPGSLAKEETAGCHHVAEQRTVTHVDRSVISQVRRALIGLIRTAPRGHKSRLATLSFWIFSGGRASPTTHCSGWIGRWRSRTESATNAL